MKNILSAIGLSVLFFGMLWAGALFCHIMQ